MFSWVFSWFCIQYKIWNTFWKKMPTTFFCINKYPRNLKICWKKLTWHAHGITYALHYMVRLHLPWVYWPLLWRLHLGNSRITMVRLTLHCLWTHICNCRWVTVLACGILTVPSYFRLCTNLFSTQLSWMCHFLVVILQHCWFLHMHTFGRLTVKGKGKGINLI